MSAFNKLRASLVAIPAITFSGLAFADDPTSLSDLTAAVDFAEVSTAILTVGGGLAAVYLLWKGAALILRAIRGL
jgi:hypothetical protein